MNAKQLWQWLHKALDARNCSIWLGQKRRIDKDQWVGHNICLGADECFEDFIIFLNNGQIGINDEFNHTLVKEWQENWPIVQAYFLRAREQWNGQIDETPEPISRVEGPEQQKEND